MKRKHLLLTGILFLLLFAIWTVLIQQVDVRPSGESGAETGFATVNEWFHRLTGVHWTLYHITDWLGLIPLLICALFGCVGLTQLLRRKSLFQVDLDILLLGGYYLIVIVCFLFFETFPINYRPVLIDGAREASYPSSTTLLVLSVMPTLRLQARRRIHHPVLQKLLSSFALFFSLFMIAGRVLAGVHWLTDIIGSFLLSGGLYCLLEGALWNFAKNCKN